MSLLKLENISYNYDKRDTPVLKDINYEFEAGKIYEIIGKSGAGKTTLLSILSSLATPTEGKIYLNQFFHIMVSKSHSFHNMLINFICYIPPIWTV